MPVRYLAFGTQDRQLWKLGVMKQAKILWVKLFGFHAKCVEWQLSNSGNMFYS